MAPVELRVGSTGAGLFVGCGAGIGIVTPLSLHAVPVVGQLAASLATSLGSLSAATGGAAATARRHVRSLGVPGMDLGFGCGVMLGYGWGAGLMLKPSALHSLAATLQSAGRAAVERLPPPLQATLAQRHGQHGGLGAAAAGAPAAGVIGSTAATTAHGWQQAGVDQPHGLAVEQQAQPGAEPSAGGASSGTAGARQQGQLAAAERDLAELSRLVLKQQNQLGDLQQQVQGLQAAVCKLDPAAPGCKLPS